VTLRRAISSLMYLMIALLIGIQPAIADAMLTASHNVNASRIPENQAETTVAINPTDPKNIAIASNIEGGFALFEAYSFDGGVSWHPQLVADGDDDLGFACCDPSMAFDRFGNLFLVYLDRSAHGGNVKSTQVAVSIDGGRSFRFLQSVELGDKKKIRPATKTGGPSIDQPTVATGHHSVWVTVKQFNKRQLLIASGARVHGLGRISRFQEPEQVPGSRFGSFGDIVVGPEGKVMVTYQDPTGDQGPATISTNVDPDGLGPTGFSDARFATRTNVGGFDFIPPQSDRSVDAEAGLAWDATHGRYEGRVYLVYTDEIRDESSDTDIFVRFSDNEGLTWSRRIRVNDDAGHNSQFNPHIEIDATTGIVGVSFHDARRDHGSGGPADTDGRANTDAQYWAAVSTNGGQSFGPNVKVSEGTSNARKADNSVDYGDYTGMDFYGGELHPAWADNSNSTGNNPAGRLGTFDVYTATVSVE
jgi:BNR/Asp-box repeat